MRSRLVRIGNSLGVRLPKSLLEQAGLTGPLSITIERGAVVIRAEGHPRAGWAESIDRLGVEPAPPGWDFPNRFDEEWEWD